MQAARRLIPIAAFLVAFATGAPAQPVPGKDYRLIDPPRPTDSGNKIEVLEFFWYGCPHCNALQPPLRNWLKKKPADVEFKRVPAVFADSWLPLTRAYYALDTLGLVDKLHYDVFAAVHEQNVRLADPRVLFDWVAKRGVDPQKFADVYNSFGVQSRARRSIDLTRQYDIPGTPALTVDGKFLVAPSMVLKPDNSVDYERYFKVLDQVIAAARKARAGR
ncbi:MAG: thiol:disulfide interchange protein DsbA/DsbL [Betaproteobacteria bacterium]|nr:thiol:disulfide interchange protein DsbA/DsbL [Betaproteobacteria bacterium]